MPSLRPRTSNRNLYRPGGSEFHAPTDGGRINSAWYSAVAWTLVTPVWAVGAFVLAVGFLAVPNVLLDGRKSLAVLSAHATSRGRALGPFLGQTGPRIALQWGRLVAATSRLMPSKWGLATVPAKPGTLSEPVAEAQA